MNPSVELKKVMLRFYASRSSGDVSTIERLFSQQEGVLFIGTDPNEWWTGNDTIDRVFRSQLREMSGTTQVHAGELNAFVEGTVGWVADCPTLRLPNGQEIPLRVTTVFHQEDGAWKIVQYHVSVGVPDTEAMGKELATK